MAAGDVAVEIVNAVTADIDAAVTAMYVTANDIVENGKLGQIVGLNIYVTPVVTNDKVLVGVAKTCGTWVQTQPLTVDVIIDPQKKYTIRASEIGVCQLTNPESLCLLTNVRA